MRRIKTSLITFIAGAVSYCLIELAYRGHTHWTMFLLSGILFTLLCRIDLSLPDEPLWKKCFMGTLLITAFEFTAGVILNIMLNWNVWDYSRIPFNILGQICLPFSALWFLLCIPAYVLCCAINKRRRKNV